MRKTILLVLCFTVVTFIPEIAFAEPHNPPQSAVVSAHPLATQAGQDILSKGGNAFDAAVAVSSMLGVVEPFGSGIGGGGFWLIYHAETERYFVIDSREVAPLLAHPYMYLDDQDEVIKGASTAGPLSAGIPGLPAAWVDVNARLGTKSLKDVLDPAIKTAQNGFSVDERYVAGASYKLDLLRENNEAASIFLDNNNAPVKGWALVQSDLAHTLSLVAEQGMSGFYEGEVAKSLVTDVKKHGGLWSLDDLSQYSVIERNPVFIDYKGAQIITPPLPSSGGLVLKNIFNILSDYELGDLSPLKRKHLIIEAMRHGYHNRALYMGDSDFYSVPTDKITSPEMAHHQRSMISLDKATPSSELSETLKSRDKGTETTHFSIIDSHGNMVAVTQSINFWFGSGLVAKGTGVLLNNEMDDFTIKPGSANGYGLVGNEANAIVPKKRMLSSMTPTFVIGQNKRAILGTPGGSRIISMNLLAILNFLDGMDGEDIISIPRYHHQFLPDKVLYEAGAFTEDETLGLQSAGHVLKQSPRPYGNMQMIIWDYKDGVIQTYSDPRGVGSGRVY